MNFGKVIYILVALISFPSEILCQGTNVQWRNLSYHVAVHATMQHQLQVQLQESVELGDERQNAYLKNLDDLTDINTLLNGTLMRLEKKLDGGKSGASPSDAQVKTIFAQCNLNFKTRFTVLDRVVTEVNKLKADSLRYKQTNADLNKAYKNLSSENQLWRSKYETSSNKIEQLSRDSDLWRRNYETSTVKLDQLIRDNESCRRNYEESSSKIEQLIRDNEVGRRSYESSSSKIDQLIRDNELWRKNFKVQNSTSTTKVKVTQG